MKSKKIEHSPNIKYNKKGIPICYKNKEYTEQHPGCGECRYDRGGKFYHKCKMSYLNKLVYEKVKKLCNDDICDEQSIINSLKFEIKYLGMLVDGSEV